MSKAEELLEQLNAVEEESLGWHIVKTGTNDQPGSGPYDTHKKARHEAQFKHWYSPDGWDIRYGYVNAEDQFVELPKPT